MISRRQLLGSGAGLAVGASLLGLSGRGQGADEDYRALAVLFLMGGNDGHNLLVPTDAMYNDYQAARVNLALPKESLAALPGSALGHTFGLHAALAMKAGRSLELMPSALRNPLLAVTMDEHLTLVLGKHSAVTFMPEFGARA